MQTTRATEIMDKNRRGRDGTVHDASWLLAGLFSSGILGLLLLGILSRRVGNDLAAFSVAIGVAVVLWATFSQTGYWPSQLDVVRIPLDHVLTDSAGYTRHFEHRAGWQAILPADERGTAQSTRVKTKMAWRGNRGLRG